MHIAGTNHAFEVTDATPPFSRGEAEHQAVVRPLDLAAGSERWAARVGA